MEIATRVRSILRDPVTLRPIDPAAVMSTSGEYLELRSGGLSVKNEQEIEHFRRTFKPLPPDERLYANRVTSLPRPETTDETIVLDIGSGPYDCLSAMPGTHIFLDDIMNLYVDEIGARLNGVRVCARTELMPFEDDSIDLLYAVNMIDHVDDMPASLAEIHRVLSPDGRLYCQSYFNSHPLLATEPGVFDASFLRDQVVTLFDVEYLRTYAPGDPTISDTYTMEIIALVLRKKPGAQPETKSRDRYEDPGYYGPQSRVARALEALEAGDGERASVEIGWLSGERFYELHHDLLLGSLAILRGNLGDANEILKSMRGHPRVARNSQARLALADLQAQRVRAHGQRRIAELDAAIAQRKGRIAELEAAVRARDARIGELQAAVGGRDARISVLSEAVAGRDARIAKLDSAIAGRNARISGLLRDKSSE